MRHSNHGTITRFKGQMPPFKVENTTSSQMKLLDHNLINIPKTFHAQSPDLILSCMSHRRSQLGHHPMAHYFDGLSSQDVPRYSPCEVTWNGSTLEHGTKHCGDLPEHFPIG
jgi:hypothetical protein